jgi:hypothetical protein
LSLSEEEGARLADFLLAWVASGSVFNAAAVDDACAGGSVFICFDDGDPGDSIVSWSLFTVCFFKKQQNNKNTASNGFLKRITNYLTDFK